MIPKKGTQKANTNLVAGQDLIRHSTNQTLQAWRVVRLQINLSVIEYQKKTLKIHKIQLHFIQTLTKKANDRTSNNRIRKKMIQPRVITNTLNHVQKKSINRLAQKIHKNLNIPFLKTKTKDLLERGFENFKEKKI